MTYGLDFAVDIAAEGRDHQPESWTECLFPRLTVAGRVRIREYWVTGITLEGSVDVP